jgi:hypothetical protein
MNEREYLKSFRVDSDGRGTHSVWQVLVINAQKYLCRNMTLRLANGTGYARRIKFFEIFGGLQMRNIWSVQFLKKKVLHALDRETPSLLF